MERLKERLAQARRAVTTLREIAGKAVPSVIERDAAILRFQYSFEAVWKTAQRYLGIVEQIETGSANAAIRSCRDVAILDDAEAATALLMLRDRNLAVHMYQEPLAAALYPKLDGYADALELWLDRLERSLARQHK